MFWSGVLVGFAIGSTLIILILSLIKIPKYKQCHCCPNIATIVRTIHGVKYLLCEECVKEFDRLGIEITC